jgi:hypothetical protein
LALNTETLNGRLNRLPLLNSAVTRISSIPVFDCTSSATKWRQFIIKNDTRKKYFIKNSYRLLSRNDY